MIKLMIYIKQYLKMYATPIDNNQIAVPPD